MIDTDGERDYAEERAQTAEQEAEQASEQEHADRVRALAHNLRALGLTARDDAHEAIGRLAEEVALRLAPNVHRYELLARQQHIALLAATVAVNIEEDRSYDLLAVAEATVVGYRRTHTDRNRPEDLTNRALASAAGRVLDLVREAVAR
jgi:hypothetical protein